MSATHEDGTIPPPQPRHACYWEVLSDRPCPYATSLAFDPHYDILWAAGGGLNEWSGPATTVRAHAFTEDRSAKNNDEAPVALRFTEYCCFKCTQSTSANARVAIGFAGDAARPLVTFTSQIGSTVTTVGGCPLYSFNVNSQITRKVVASMAEPDAILCSGEAPGLMRIKLDDAKQQVNVPIGLPSSIETMSAANTHITALPQYYRPDVSWLPVGLSGGHVVIIDRNSFAHVAATPKLFHKIHTLRCHGNTIVATYGIGNTTTIKMFDIRKIHESAEPLNQVAVDGTLVDLDMFESPYIGGVEMFLVTNSYFYVLNTECPEPLNRSLRTNVSLTASATSRSGKLAAISMAATKDNNGHIVPLRRCGLTREELPEHLGDAFRLPPEPNRSRQFTPYTDPISSGFEADKCPSGKLFSDWPPDNYMIQKVQGKLKMFSIPWALRRCDVYRYDPTDKFNSILPNPYPFNLKVGTDPARVPEILIPKLKELREQQRNNAVINSNRRQVLQPFVTGNSYYDNDIINRSFYPLEDATQKCFPLGGVPFEWNHWNSSLSGSRHVIGTDNSFPECWISPVIQSLYLIHSKQGNNNNNNNNNNSIDLFDYPIRQLLSRHFCQRIDCVACELAIVFANMCTAAADTTMPPIVQLSPLLTVLRNRAEFKAAKVFEPAKDREEMLRNMQLFQRLLLEVLHADFYTMRQEDELPNLPMPDGSNTRIASTFGGTLCGPNDATMLPHSVVWEIPSMASSLDEGLRHLLNQSKYASLPQVFVLLLDPSLQENVTSEISIHFSKYKLQSCIYHVAEDNDDPGLFVTTVPNPGCPSPRSFLIHDYSVAEVPLREFSDSDNTLAFEALVPRHLNHTLVAAYYVAENFPVAFRYDDQGIGKDPLPFTRFLLNAFPFAASQMIRDTLSYRLPQRQPPTESRRRRQHNKNSSSCSAARVVTAPEPLTAADSPSSLSGEPFTIASVDSGFDPVIGPSHNMNNNNNNSHNTSRNYSNSNSNSITPPLHPVPSPPLAPDYDLSIGDVGPRNFQTTVLDIGDIKSTDLVAIDAEYVVPCWGNNLSRNTSKKNFLLARVSCLLSSRAGDERLLFDDYLWTREPIQDYVSTFSGIHDGDLDPERSPYRLTTMKAVYLKLRALVDHGVRFVGHGLSQDFRVCNIQVPPRQVLDTLDLYHKATGRRSTLKHLAQAVLELSVQEGEHDSVEDARASLRLYYKHEELSRQGTLEQVLDTALAAWGSPSSLRTPMTLPSAATATDASNRSTQSQSSRGTTPSTLPNHTTNTRSAFGGSAVTTPSQVPPVEAAQAFPSVPPAA